MNIEEYIASGVLESYVMGELSEQEMRKVECMALVHEPIQEELRRVEESYEVMAMATAVSPDVDLKEKLWNDIQAADNETETPVVSMSSHEEKELQSATPGFNWARAASIAALMGLAAFGWMSNQKNETLTSELEEQRAQQLQMETELAEATARSEESARQLAIVNSSEYTAVKLKGTDNAPAAQAQVFWSNSSKDVYLRVDAMAALPSGKVYQLWILNDGVPIDAGTFSATEDSKLIKMKNVEQGQTFAVTIEDEGGSLVPALETLQVIGNIPV